MLAYKLFFVGFLGFRLWTRGKTVAIRYWNEAPHGIRTFKWTGESPKLCSWLSLLHLLDHRALLFSLLFIFQCCGSFLKLFICFTRRDPLFHSLCSCRYPTAQSSDLDSRPSLMWAMWPLRSRCPLASPVLSFARVGSTQGESQSLTPYNPLQPSPDPPPPPNPAPAAVLLLKHMMYHNTNPPHFCPPPLSHPNIHVWARTNDAIGSLNI